MFRSYLYCFTSLVLLQGILEANPKEGKIISGSASISSKTGKMKIDQSSKNAVIHWKDFSIQEGEITEFSVSHHKGATLNRVMGKNFSEIAGLLRSNGKIYLINPNGILVTPTGVVNTAGIVLTTLNISDDDFLFDRSLSFKGESDARVVNLGKISTAAGDVVFVGQAIENQGTIEALEGGVYLAAGKEVLMLPEGERRIQIKVPVSDSISGNRVDHSGIIKAAHVEIEANGGNPYALAVKSSGAIHVKGFTEKEGQIFLTADDQANIEISGMLTAERENGSGGDIRIFGNRVQVTSDAQLGASSGAGEGNGGNVYILGNAWASLESDVYAQGGVKKGDGGFIELSAPIVHCLKTAYVNARDGVSRNGEFLLDPYNVWIATAIGTQPTDWSVVLTDSIATVINGGSDFTIDTSSSANYDLVGSNALTGMITVNDPISLNGTGAFNLIADDSITVNNSIANGQTGGYTFTAANDIIINYPISTESTTAISFTATAGTLTLEQSGGNSGSISTSGDINLTAAGAIGINTAASLLSTSGLTSTNGSITLMTTGTGAITTLNSPSNGQFMQCPNGNLSFTTSSTGNITFAGTASCLNATFMGGTGSHIYIGNDVTGSLSIGTGTTISSPTSTNSLTIAGDAVTIKGGTITAMQMRSGGVQWSGQNLTITANNGNIVFQGGDTHLAASSIEQSGIDMRSIVTNSIHTYNASGTIQILGGAAGDNNFVTLGPNGLGGASGYSTLNTGSNMSLIAGNGNNSSVELHSGGGTLGDTLSIGGSLILTAGSTSGTTIILNDQHPTPSPAATYTITNNLTVTSGSGGSTGTPSGVANFYNGNFHAGGDVILQGGSSLNAGISFDSDNNGGTINIEGNFSAIGGSSHNTSVSGVLSTNNGSINVTKNFTVQGGTGENSGSQIQLGNEISTGETLNIGGAALIQGETGTAEFIFGDGFTFQEGEILIAGNCTVSGGAGGSLTPSTGAAEILGLGFLHLEIGGTLQISGGSGLNAMSQIASYLFPGTITNQQLIYVKGNTTIQGGGGGNASAVIGLGTLGIAGTQTIALGGNLNITGGSGATATASIVNDAFIGTFMGTPFDSDAPTLNLNVLGNIICTNQTFPGAPATIGGTSGFSFLVPGLSAAPGSVTVKAGGNIQLASSLDVTFSGISSFNATHFQTYISNVQFALGALWPGNVILGTSPASIYPVGRGAFINNNNISDIVLTTKQGNITIVSAQDDINGAPVNFAYGASANNFLFATTSGNFYVTGLTDMTINSTATTAGNSMLFPGSAAQIDFAAYNTLNVNQPVTISGPNFGIQLESDLPSTTAGTINLAANVSANTINGFATLRAHTGGIIQTAGTVTANSITMVASTGITGLIAPYNLLSTAGSVIAATNLISNNLSIMNTIIGNNAQFVSAILTNGAGMTFSNRSLYFEQFGGTSLNILNATTNGDLLIGVLAGQGNLTISGFVIPGRDAMHVANGTVSLASTGAIQGVGKVTVVCDQAFPSSVGPGQFLNNSTSGGVTTTDPTQDIAIYAASGPQPPVGVTAPMRVVLGNLSPIATWDIALPDGLHSKYDTSYSSGGPVHGPGFANYNPGNGVFGSSVIWYKYNFLEPLAPTTSGSLSISIGRQVKVAVAIQGLTLEPYLKRVAYSLYSVNIVSYDRKTLVPIYEYDLIIPFTSVNMRPYDSFEVAQYEINPN